MLIGSTTARRGKSLCLVREPEARILPGAASSANSWRLLRRYTSRGFQAAFLHFSLGLKFDIIMGHFQGSSDRLIFSQDVNQFQ